MACEVLKIGRVMVQIHLNLDYLFKNKDLRVNSNCKVAYKFNCRCSWKLLRMLNGIEPQSCCVAVSIGTYYEKYLLSCYGKVISKSLEIFQIWNTC